MHFFQVESVFEPGDIIIGSISSCHEHRNEFYIVEEGTEHMINIYKETLQEISHVPNFHEKFIFVVNESFFRAERLSVDDELDPFLYMKVFLLDTGESFDVDITETFPSKFLVMPRALKRVPPLALRSQLLDKHVKNGYDIVQNNLYQKMKFEVVKVENGILKVKTLPFQIIETNNSYNGNNSKDSIDKEFQLKPLTDFKMLTSEQVEIFYEEPVTTDDPLVAVQGFRTHDDDRICKFYDSEIGGCFKGGRCKLRHVKENENELCRDKSESYFESELLHLPMPALHTIVKIKVTHFVNVTNFYCQYWEDKSTTKELTLKKLTKQLNEPEKIAAFKPLTDLPALKQLVTVESNGMFYRGRIEQFLDESEVEVFLVDMGVFETIDINRIYQWSERFNNLPFQSFEMQIANIKNAEGDIGQKAIDRIMTYIKESEKDYLEALIYDNVPDIKCALFIEDEDIGEKLVDEGFVQAKHISAPTPEHINYFLPG